MNLTCMRLVNYVTKDSYRKYHNQYTLYVAW